MARAPCPPFVRPGGLVGRGVALPRSVPLPSLGRQQSGCHWRRSGHGGRGPHTTPVCARPPSLGAICAASWRVGAGSLVPRGSCGSRRLGPGGRAVLRLLSRAGGGGTIPPASGAGGRRPRGLRAGWGGGGGGRAAASLLPLWGAARGSLPWPPSCRRRTPPRRARSVGVAGPPRGGGMRGGPGMQRSRAWCGTPPILGVVNMVGTRNFTCYMGAL